MLLIHEENKYRETCPRCGKKIKYPKIPENRKKVITINTRCRECGEKIEIWYKAT